MIWFFSICLLVRHNRACKVVTLDSTWPLDLFHLFVQDLICWEVVSGERFHTKPQIPNFRSHFLLNDSQLELGSSLYLNQGICSTAHHGLYSFVYYLLSPEAIWVWDPWPSLFLPLFPFQCSFAVHVGSGVPSSEGIFIFNSSLISTAPSCTAALCSPWILWFVSRCLPKVSCSHSGVGFSEVLESPVCDARINGVWLVHWLVWHHPNPQPG